MMGSSGWYGEYHGGLVQKGLVSTWTSEKITMNGASQQRYKHREQLI